HKVYEESGELGDEAHTHFEGIVLAGGEQVAINGVGNGPIDAFFQALKGIGVTGYEFISYHEHAISRGSDSKAISYIELKVPGNGHVFGVGIAANINLASILGVLCAINRALGHKQTR
ncbi:MAG: alpha-isopropylmalate synthase regulatory domain-containing protein, partial [Acidaminococcaceae bacterium]